VPIREIRTSRNERKLVDRFGRQVTYLRISVTDRCDFRCVYCMSENMSFAPRAQILTLEEILTIARAFSELGVTRIRVTGGEPLVRRNVLWLLREVGRLPGLQELTLTTNGSQLERLASLLRKAGVRRLNISLDSLKVERFRRITRAGNLEKVLRGVEAAQKAGFERIRINSVILKNRNHDEVVDLVKFAIERTLDIAFIEEMPLGLIDGHDRAEVFYSSDEIKRDLERSFELLPSTERSGGPARYFQVQSTGTRLGFISPHTHNFCASCNRVRLTTEGRLLLCLGQEHSVDLRRVVRANPGELDVLKDAIMRSMALKPKGHEFDLRASPMILRHMNTTGG
jgi:cyclic pyranopterin phosphate synthase